MLSILGLRSFLVLTVILLGARWAGAQNKYDVLAKTLQPYLSLFYSKSPTKAMVALATIREATQITPLLLNRPMRISFQFPDKLRVETEDDGQKIILCRDGQNVWVYPKDLGEQLLSSADLSRSSQTIPDFRLPFRDQQIVLLPALFQILRYETTTDPSGQAAWNLEFRIDPQLAKSLKDSFVVQTLVRQNDYQVEKIRAKSGAFSGILEVSSIQFLSSLPAATWHAEEAIIADAVTLPPAAYRSALQKIASLTFFQ
jgi:outer membrane lipoprotein-sorting protein